MELSTTSAAITFAKSLENDSLEVFERLAEQYPHWNALLAPLIRENKYNVRTIERAYIGVVSDALDTQFAFQGIDYDGAVRLFEVDDHVKTINEDIVFQDREYLVRGNTYFGH